MQQASWYFEKLKRPFDPLQRWIVRQLAARPSPRLLLNRYYESLSSDRKSRFERRYGQVFRSRGLLGGDGVAMSPGDWTVHFAGREIRLPLRPEWAWLDWEHAVALMGNDAEVIQTYEAIIASDQRPTLFLDVGANYGTHSLLLLSAGIPTVSFEPNSTCLQHFQAICKLNGVEGKWEPVAIGNGTGQVEFFYPETHTWLGSMAPDYVATLKATGKVVTEHVPLRKLDEYIHEVSGQNVLIKIDVEGLEADVIRGASQLLRECQPRLVFESFAFRPSADVARSRDELFRVLDERGYAIQALPWQPSAPARALRLDEFLTSTGNNFIALPR